MRPTSLTDFYEEAAAFLGRDVSSLLPPGIANDVGHFNIFDISETIEDVKRRSVMPYNRRAYYKISLICGRSRAEYADKVLETKKHALLFATPQVPYRWVPLDGSLSGAFCIFTEAFLVPTKSGMDLDTLPLFRPGGYPVFEIGEEAATEIRALFGRMQREISGDYAHKYDLLRNYVVELLHWGQKLQPSAAPQPAANAAFRTALLFAELLERQFPLTTPGQRIQLRAAAAFAARLGVHVNHLNKTVRACTGQTTTALISARVLQEAKILLKSSDWNVSEISWSLGFEELAHFSNFFRKGAGVSPMTFRAGLPV